MTSLTAPRGKRRPNNLTPEQSAIWLLRNSTHTNDGCLESPLVSNKRGYTQIRIGPVKIAAHRFIYEAVHGPIPDGLLVRHTCDNPACIHPQHLITGTHQDNMQDAVDRRRTTFGERSGRSKLSEQKVHEIKQRLNSGEKPKPIAEDYPVTSANISHINTGRCWRHLNE